MKRTAVILVLSILAALTMDATVGPIVWGRWVQLHFVAAAVALWGMKRGSWVGLMAGWTAALAQSAVSSDPIGISMLSLGATGFVAGAVVKIDSASVAWLDALTLFLLVLGEHILSSAMAWAVASDTPHVGLGGLLFTAVVMSFGFYSRQAVRPGRRRSSAGERSSL